MLLSLVGLWFQIEARHQRLLLVPSFFETCLKLWPADSYRFPCSLRFLSAKKLQEEKNMELEENVQKQETPAILWPKNRVGVVPFFPHVIPQTQVSDGNMLGEEY